MKCPISRYLRVILLTFIIMNIDNKLTIACPSEVCICKWKGGKQTVECGGQLLSKIPEGMDPGTQVLNFSGNSLQVLQSERFLRMDLINLQKIFLSRNQLIKIHEKAFRGLSNLVELDLSDNMLQQVPTETFQDYTSLMRLSLSGNPIRELKTSAFRHLAFLTTLELSNCQIDKIENEGFIGMDNLEWLRLDGNRISTIEGNHILPKSLHGINLQSNRWYCDCHLTDFHAWLINYNIPQIEEPKCIEPVRLKGQVIKSLKKDELACLPDIRPKSTYTEISEGRNISLMCTVRAIPEATVLWLFNGQVLTNDSFLENLHMYYYIDETGGEEKRSEVFIYNIGPEDNGTFSCIARNTAGTSFTNYTIRVLIKEPPVVKEVSFPKQYMHIIVASIGGIGTLVLITMCTIIIKCRNREPRNKSNKSETQTNDSGLLKCPSIINEEDMSPKATKENGIIIGSGGLGGGLGSGGGMMGGGGGGGGGGHGGGQIKQNFMMYVATMPQGHILDTGNMQLSHQSTASSPPINSGQNGMGMGGGIIGGSNMSSQYCSPQSSLRNYHPHHHHQDKNPDLINDAESVKNKLKADSEYEGSDCSTGPCSIQGNFENCYQLSNQFGSQIIRPPAQQGGHRFTTMSTMPRGMHGGGNKGPPTSQGTGAGVGPGGNAGSVITTMGGIGGSGLVGVNSQHQVDVHLNPVCFLGQDGYAYDFSNNHIHSGPATVTASQPNFYRTLPHNRGHNKLHGSAANPGTRYSLEAEFLQRTATPPYDKYAVHNMRFTAEGYPVHPMQQYPSPPDGYKGGDYSLPPEPLNAGQSICPTTSFQQWPPCLPGYHAQPIRYPTGTIGITSQHSVPSVPPPPSLSSVASAGACTTTSSNHTQTATTSTSTLPTEVKKRCVGAQTTELDPDTIPECEEENETTSNSGSTSKLRHLSGPLADSPDEGYVGDSQESSDI